MDKFLFLKLFIDHPEQDILDAYSEHIIKHNTKLNNDAPFQDSGFDLFIPFKTLFESSKATKVDLKIKCAAYFNDSPSPFYVYPRSSLSKTQLRLANSVGIIDSGYRGSLIGAFDNISKEDVEVEPFTRLLQICGPSLQPVWVELVYSEEDLGYTNRGEGGFGSTGIFGSINQTATELNIEETINQIEQMLNNGSNIFQNFNNLHQAEDVELNVLDIEPVVDIEPVD